LQAWVQAHPQEYAKLLQKWHIYSGARFGDFGHFEWGGVPFSRQEMRELGLTKEGGQKTSAAPPPPATSTSTALSPPPPKRTSSVITPNINVRLALSGPPGTRASALMTSDNDELFDVNRIHKVIMGTA
jgi:hypothetical protein